MSVTMPEDDGAAAPVERPHVLWIDGALRDDQPEIQRLRLAGIDVDCAGTADEGLARARTADYDVVLLERHLPDGSGLDLLRALVAAGVSAPVVMLTRLADIESAVMAIKLGASDYREKPADAGAIVSLLHRITARREEPRHTRACQAQDDWLRWHTGRLDVCRTPTELIAVVVDMILDRRITLPAFVVCAAALKLVLTDPTAELPRIVERTRVTLAQAASLPPPRHPKLRQALATLEREGHRQAPPALAQRIGLSRTYFSRLMFEETGRHTSEWCRAAVMRAALRRLCESTEAISQIAYAAGHEHVGQFNRDFTHAFGIPPSRLRRVIAHA